MKQLSGYFKRYCLLKKLGFHSYDDYLKSDLWQNIRAAVLTRDNFVCYGCRGQATQVHHNSYCLKALKGVGKPSRTLISICGTCHKAISIKNGKITSLTEANHLLAALKKTIHFRGEDNLVALDTNLLAPTVAQPD